MQKNIFDLRVSKLVALGREVRHDQMIGQGVLYLPRHNALGDRAAVAGLLRHVEVRFPIAVRQIEDGEIPVEVFRQNSQFRRAVHRRGLKMGGIEIQQHQGGS